MWFISKLYIPAWEYIEYICERSREGELHLYILESIEYFKPPLNVIISHEGMFVPIEKNSSKIWKWFKEPKNNYNKIIRKLSLLLLLKNSRPIYKGT